jgi:hypothetical protein
MRPIIRDNAVLIRQAIKKINRWLHYEAIPEEEHGY